jgi:1-aminocyclopropane-1-carboxylate deaminase/D-cysteine desulfhydrase-like pyridoxal-dependent ACC family enzyme/GNAT superfamily N-acetyltransferase
MKRINHSMASKKEKPEINIVWNGDYKLSHTKLADLLKEFGDLLPDPLSKRMDLSSYAEKLQKNADIELAFHDEKTVGFLAIYTNDIDSGKAHIPIVSVLSDYRGYGIGKVLLSRAIALARQKKMLNLWLTVDQDNFIAQHVYSQLRFTKISSTETKFIMSRDLTLNKFLLEPQVTAVESGKTLATLLGLDIDLRIKRDDLYPISGGGIKARKIGYIIKKAIDDGYDAIVTNGGPQSNHARAASILASNLGIKCHLVIVLENGQEYSNSGNILLMRMSGASIEYTTKDKLACRMDEAINDLTKRGYKPLYIWGGGHCFQGTVAFVDAAKEAQNQCGDWIPDYLVLASGTGTTQAGLAIGYALKAQVIGISIAREQDRGFQVIQKCIDDYYLETGEQDPGVEVIFRDEWIGGGYEKYSRGLFELIDKAAKAGYFFDPTYSGKALQGLVSLVQKGEIPAGSKVLFWHTGGLMNLISSNQITGIYSNTKNL